VLSRLQFSTQAAPPLPPNAGDPLGVSAQRASTQSEQSTTSEVTAKLTPAVGDDDKDEGEAAEAAKAKAEAEAKELVTWSRLWALVYPERGNLAVGLVLNACGSAISLVLPYAFGVVVDGSATQWRDGFAVGSSALTPAGAAAGLFGLFSVQSVMSVARQHVLNVAGERVAEAARRRAFGNLLQQEVAFFDKEDSGELVNRLSADAAQLRQVLTASLTQLFSACASGIGAIAMLFYLSPPLCAVSLAMFPAVFLFASWRGRRMRKEQKRVQEELAAATAIAQRSLLNVRTLRALGAEAALQPAYDGAVRSAADLAVQVGWTQAIFNSTVYFASNLSLLAILGYGAQLVVDGSMTPGALSSFLCYSLYLGFATSGLSTTYTDFQRATGATERLLMLMDRESAMARDASLKPYAAPAVGSGGLRVELKDVDFSYPTREAPTLSKFSLEVSAGERVAIRGLSGSGKSTILRLVSRLYDVDGGCVTVGGVDVRDVDPKLLRGGLVGVVPQEPTLISGTIVDNVRLGCVAATDEQIDAALDQAGLGPLIARLPQGRLTLVGEQGAQLSGGEKQRVALARLLVADPRIVLLDEFSSALDHQTMVDVARNLRPILAGRTVICVAHHDAVLREIGIQRLVDCGLGGEILNDSKTDWAA